MQKIYKEVFILNHKMSDYKVRGVCSANVQRSPTFEAVAKYALSETRETTPHQIIIDSAGINVRNILNNTMPSNTMLKVLDAGLKYGVVRKETQEHVKTLVRKYLGKEQIPEQDIAAITFFYSEIRPLVHSKIATYRDIALEKAGIPKHLLPGIYNPFNLDCAVDLILPMAMRVLEKVTWAYSTSPHQTPTIVTYGNLVGREDLEDNLAGGLEEAVRQVEFFMDTRHEAVKGILKLSESKK